MIAESVGRRRPSFDPSGDSGASARALERARRAQPGWAARSIGERLRVVAATRRLVAAHAVRLADTVGRPERSQTLSAELLPLLDALRFLEREAPRLLATRRPGRRGRPLWLSGVSTEVYREPLGVVLVLAPANYPLLLPGVQAVQALTAGNAVLVKPAPGAAEAMRVLDELLTEAGLPAGLFELLPDSIDAARTAIRRGVDHVVLTGHAETGRAVLGQLASRLTPATMELSGCDAMFVRSDADPRSVATALSFGMMLNGGATCIAPRRVLLPPPLVDPIAGELTRALAGAPAVELSTASANAANAAISGALQRGARLVFGGVPREGRMAPTLLAGVSPTMLVARVDLFAPLAALIEVDDDEAALEAASSCPYALGASVFGSDSNAAEALARRVRAGTVVVNDLIVPTADPRVPFGGRGESGFGVTRGAEGLLAMTAPKALMVQRKRRPKHLDAPPANADDLFEAWIGVAHGASLLQRFGSLRRLLRAGRIAWHERAGREHGSIRREDR